MPFLNRKARYSASFSVKFKVAPSTSWQYYHRETGSFQQSKINKKYRINIAIIHFSRSNILYYYGKSGGKQGDTISHHLIRS